MKRVSAVLFSFLLLAGACSSDSGGGGGDGDDGTDSTGDDGGDDGGPDAGFDPTGEPPTVAGCDSAMLYENPSDTSATGPWAVGAKTITIGRLTTEVWYPAEWASQVGQDKIRYDIRENLPPSQQDIIPDEKNTWQDCDCYRDLPLDTTHGPYPVVLFVHGTASFRTQSLKHATHWASRGFVVISADHPGLKLADTLALLCPDQASGSRNLSGDADAMLGALQAAQGELSFLAGHVDMTRVAAVGHSAGGGAVAGFATKPGVRVIIPFSSGGAVQGGGSLESTLFVSGMNDAIAQYGGVQSAYQGSPSPKRLVGIEDSGHLVVSDLCDIKNVDGKNMLEVAQEYNICGTILGGGLFDCEPGYIPGPAGWEIVNYATSAVLEDVLQCANTAGNFDSMESRFEYVGELRQDL